MCQSLHNEFTKITEKQNKPKQSKCGMCMMKVWNEQECSGLVRKV